jgi:hypothetical protein
LVSGSTRGPRFHRMQPTRRRERPTGDILPGVRNQATAGRRGTTSERQIRCRSPSWRGAQIMKPVVPKPQRCAISVVRCLGSLQMNVFRSAPEAPPLQSAVGIAPTLQSGSSPPQAGVVTHSVAALRSATAESAEESQVLTESSTSSAESPGGIASELESGLSPAQTTAVAPSVPALQSQPEKEPPKLAKVVVPAGERAGATE